MSYVIIMLRKRSTRTYHLYFHKHADSSTANKQTTYALHIYTQTIHISYRPQDNYNYQTRYKMPKLGFLNKKAANSSDKTPSFTINAYSQTIINNSPAKPSGKRQKLSVTLKEVHACRFTNEDNELVEPAGYRSRVLSDNLLWSITFKKLVRVTAQLKQQNQVPPATSEVLSDLIDAAMEKNNTLTQTISWLDVANLEIRNLTAELQQDGIAINTNTVLLSYFLEYPILYSGWLASPQDKQRAAKDNIHFCTPCPICHSSSPLSIVLDSKLRGNFYGPRTPCIKLLLNENALVEHLNLPALGTRSRVQLDDNFLHLHALIGEIYSQIKKSNTKIAKAIDKDFNDVFPEDTEFKESTALVLKDPIPGDGKTSDEKANDQEMADGGTSSSNQNAHKP